MRKQRVIQKVDPLVVAAIMERANRDALIEWAKRGPMPLPVFTPEPKLKLTLATAHVLGRQMVKRAVSIMTP